jgi:GcrA cell cycle regulator
MNIWDHFNTERLRQLWASGLTASQCAKRIPGATRNSIIGKVWRLGLSYDRPTRIGLSPEEKQSRNRMRAREWAARRREALTKLGFRSARSPSRALTAAELSSALQDAPPLPFDPHEARDLVVLDCEPKEHERISLIEAKLHQCRWPYDDGKVCGRPTVSVGGCYFCSHHARRAYFPKNGRHVA